MKMDYAMNRANSGEKLSPGVKFAYGLSGYSSFITWTIFSYYGLYFFTDIIGFSAGFAAAIISLGTIWDAVSDPIIGILSDNRQSDKGRRRPLIIGIAIPFVFVSILLFTDFNLSETASKVYFITAIILYYTAQTVLDIACSSLGTEMTLDYDERSSLAAIKNFFCMLVILAVSPMLLLVRHTGNLFDNVNFGWAATVSIYMAFALLCIFIIWKATAGYERFKNAEKFVYRDIPKIFKQNKAIRYVMLLFALGVFANTVNLTMQVYFYSYNMGLSEGQIASVMMASGIACCAAAFGVDFLCKKLSKKAAWMLTIGVLIVSYVALIGFMAQPGRMAVLYVFAVVISLGMCAVYQVPWSMIPDCVEINELQSGQRIEGVIFGFTSFIQKVAAAISISAAGAALTAVGYVANEAQTAQTLEGMRWLFVLGVCIPYFISLLLAYKYPLGKERHAQVLKAIEDKRKGIAFNREDFKDLL